MATYSWPSDIEQTKQADTPIREPGLIGWYPGYTMPEYPDNSAGTTYLGVDFDDADGWTGFYGVGSVTAADGELVITPSGTGGPSAIISKALVSGTKMLCIKIRYNANIASIKYYDGSAYQSMTLKHVGDYYVASALCATADPVYTYIAIDGMVSWQTTDLLYVKIIYVGTGAYDSRVIDTSGSGNDLVPVGSLFVDGKCIRNGVTDYESSAAVLTEFPDLFHYHEHFDTITVGASAGPLFAYYGAPAVIFAYVDSSANLIVAHADGSAAAIFASYFSGHNTNVTVDVFADYSAGTITVCRNGQLFDTKEMAAISKPTAGGYITYGTFGSYFLTSTSSNRRIYARELSAAEIADLYNNPLPYPYEALPSLPLQNGYKETREPSLIRTTLDSGPAKTRRRYTAVSAYYDLQYALPENQKQILEDFHNRLTAFGALPFNWTHPTTGVVSEARFLEPPSFTANDHEYIASIRLEVLP